MTKVISLVIGGVNKFWICFKFRAGEWWVGQGVAHIWGVAAMGWEQRGTSGKTYLYVSHRDGSGKAIKTYIGTGAGAVQLL